MVKKVMTANEIWNRTCAIRSRLVVSKRWNPFTDQEWSIINDVSMKAAQERLSKEEVDSWFDIINNAKQRRPHSTHLKQLEQIGLLYREGEYCFPSPPK